VGDSSSPSSGLSRSLTDSGGMSERPVGSASEPCPLTQEVRVVELVEVVEHRGRTTTQAPAPRNQYINLDDQVDTANPHPEYGRCIRLKARVEWVAGDPNRPLNGHTVYWYATAGGGNKSGLTGSELPGFDAAGTNTLRKTTTTDRNGWTPVVEFYLSRYGGDEFTIGATEDSSYRGGQTAGPYTVWRKFWYQVTEMQRPSRGGVFELPATVRSAFESAYRTVYALFEEQSPRRQSPYAENLEQDSARRSHVRPFFRSDDLVPFKLHIATIDYASTIGERTVTDTMRNPTYRTPDTYWLWMRGSGTHPWKIRARYRRTGRLVWHCNRRRPACPGHSSPRHRCQNVEGAVWDCGARDCPGHSSPRDRCREGVWHCNRVRPACPGHSSPSHRCRDGEMWRCGARDCPGHSAPNHRCTHSWQDIPDDKLSDVPAPSCRGWKRIRIDFSDGPVTPSERNPVEIELVFRHASFVALGWGGGSSAIFLCSGTTEDAYSGTTAEQRLSSILTHEGGHAFGLVNMTPSPAHAHDAWEHPDHGHHCELPASDCVMWYQITSDSGTAFHLASDGTGCRDALRRQDYSRGPMAHWSRT